MQIGDWRTKTARGNISRQHDGAFAGFELLRAAIGGMISGKS